MKSSEIIAALQHLDPTGEMEVQHDNSEWGPLPTEAVEEQIAEIGHYNPSGIGFIVTGHKRILVIK